MDKLDAIFERQEAFNAQLRAARKLSYSSGEWIQKETLAMLSELSELLDEVNFKWWKNDVPINDDNVKDELVDVLHFFVSMCLDAGMDAEDLHRRYLAKNQENFDRQSGKSQKKGYEQAGDSKM